MNVKKKPRKDSKSDNGSPLQNNPAHARNLIIKVAIYAAVLCNMRRVCEA